MIDGFGIRVTRAPAGRNAFVEKKREPNFKRSIFDNFSHLIVKKEHFLFE